MQFKSFLYLASVLAVSLASTPQTVLSDLTALQSSITTLDNAINAFPNTGGSLVAALAIHTDAQNTETALGQTTTDAQALSPSPVSVADGTSIINEVNVIRPIIEDALTAIVAKKPAFDALPLGGVSALVLQDLQALSADTQTLATALIAATPASLQSQANSLANEIESAFATAIAAYS
ncbi:hypothetical protein P691DRAFT_735440 [Macrolepiota fuliginosa MF-IS2]|uniref:Hydrophobic surface binding protein n=1 Tax=Macrolepiota fuliginosa MF-IS2 TaxID=1400762 RepID=A0A9P6BZ95_9AGAR|nr:hypothetical protein P691DRAFT_735440 [Macrolepiota fuliginosa MF-IS2]